MEEWKEYKISDLTIMKNGKKRPSGVGQFAVYGGNGVMDYANDYNAENTIIVGRVGAYCGNVYHCSGKCWVSDNAIAVFANDLIDIKFLFYLMSSLDLHHQHIGGAQPLMTQDIIGGFDVSIPSLETQKKVTSILSLLDSKIELNRRINDNLEQQAQALFKSWFVDFEPFKDDKFIESELGMIPEGWRVGKAEDFYKINIGKTPPRKEQKWFSHDSSNITWVSISDLGAGGYYIFESSEYLTKEAVDNFNVVMVPKYTVLLSFKLTVGRVAIAGKDLTTNEAIARFVTSKVNREYTYLLLKGYNYNLLGSTSSIATAVNSKIIKEMKIVMPENEVLNRFSSLVKPYFDQIQKKEEENNQLIALRDSILPKLMSGELKINDLNC